MDKTRNPTEESDDLITSIASIILGGGLIAFVLWKWSAIELINVFLIVILPFSLLAVGLRLISWSTFRAVWHFDLRSRVSEKISELRAKMDEDEDDIPVREARDHLPTTN